ncbi:hypothetical protein [Streptomyces acidiscabies]|uniref:hypothetical protein n=1 Tax=Streptomyces acidiscabies TaxID=42234 RepID=UPI0038F7FCEF
MTGVPEPSRLESRKVRRLLLCCLVLPPIASVVASAIGALDLTASLAIMVGADLTLLTILVEITLQGRAAQRAEVKAFRNDDEAVPYLIAHVVQERPRTVDLLEYSAFGALPLLAKLGEEGCTRQVRLLVAHPSAAISDYQRDYRLAEGLRALAYRIPADRAQSIGLQIKCYSETASLRGRLLGKEVLAVGWYSYDDRGLADPGGRPLSGGSNSLVGTTVHSAEGRHLMNLYQRVFENLWRDAAEPDQAWEPYRGVLPHLPSAEWLTVVRSHA